MNTLNKIYFLGIGGIGMSALARYYNHRGVAIYGYDKTKTPLTAALEAEGMRIHYEDDTEAIPDDVDMVVYTPAVPQNLRIWQFFKNAGLPMKKRAEVLGQISREKRTIAIAGTHGKTTTTAITAHLLKVGGVDCAAFMGGIAANFNSNFVDGKDNWLVVEADEFDRSFLHLSPDIGIILSMDADHLDVYGDEMNILESGFLAFAKRIRKDGKVLVNKIFAEHFDNQTINTIGLDAGDYRAKNIRVENNYMVFDFEGPEGRIEALQFTLPGRHNVFDAVAAIAVAKILKIQDDSIRKALVSFKGIRRRFEWLLRRDKVYIDDYAHHPTELKAAISAARLLYPHQKLTGIFQPHLYSRTRDFADGFAEALGQLDEIILLDIYPAREEPIPGVTSEIIFNKIDNEKKILTTKNELMNHLENNLDIEVLMTLGAGDIDTFRQPIKILLEQTA